MFFPWADAWEDAQGFVARLPELDLAGRVSDANDAALLRMARLDRDWYGECARCFAAARHPDLDFLPARVVGATGMAAFAAAYQRRPPEEEWWLCFMGQHPKQLGPALGKLCAFTRKCGVRLLYYAFDEASRTMPGFDALAPHLDVLIHDESPLAPAGQAALNPACHALHRSWVANVLPGEPPFNPAPEERIVFLGSQLGLSEHRKRQIAFLQKIFRDRFTAFHDHSVAVADRFALNRFKVGLCPEGRKFATPAMARTHTDRPFWSGCLGLVPVSENSRPGGRLDTLHETGLIVRYEHGDLAGLKTACEQALAWTTEQRRRVYDYFNTHETVGTVVAEQIAAAR